ncbi:MAG: hypothetical protein ACLFU8_08970, partial [Anaerolineales bacterium]
MQRRLWLITLVLTLLVMSGIQPLRGVTPPPPTVGEAVSLEGTPGELEACYDGCGDVDGVPSSNEAYEQEVV